MSPLLILIEYAILWNHQKHHQQQFHQQQHYTSANNIISKGFKEAEERWAKDLRG